MSSTYPDKFIRDNVVAPLVPRSVVIVTLPKVHALLKVVGEFTLLHFVSLFLPTLLNNSVKCPCNVVCDSVTL